MQATVPTRLLGTTGREVSTVAFGGAVLGTNAFDNVEAAHVLHRAVDQGVTLIDTSWEYGAGHGEERIGSALSLAGYRKRVFLASRFTGRDRRTAAEQLDESLARLQTDYLDLWMIDENNRHNDADDVFAPGGAIEAMLAAKEAGKVRFLGFSGHRNPAYHVHMFEVALHHGVTFDVVQMPLNVMDAHFRSFERTVVPVARRAGTAIIATNPFGDGQILETRVCSPLQMMQYCLTLPVTSLVVEVDSQATLDQAVTAAVTFRPLSDLQVSAILGRTGPVSLDGAFERYKVGA